MEENSIPRFRLFYGILLFGLFLGFFYPTFIASGKLVGQNPFYWLEKTLMICALGVAIMTVALYLIMTNFKKAEVGANFRRATIGMTIVSGVYIFTWILFSDLKMVKDLAEFFVDIFGEEFGLFVLYALPMVILCSGLMTAAQSFFYLDFDTNIKGGKLVGGGLVTLGGVFGVWILILLLAYNGSAFSGKDGEGLIKIISLVWKIGVLVTMGGIIWGLIAPMESLSDDDEEEDAGSDYLDNDDNANPTTSSQCEQPNANTAPDNRSMLRTAPDDEITQLIDEETVRINLDDSDDSRIFDKK